MQRKQIHVTMPQASWHLRSLIEEQKILTAKPKEESKS
jgi:hypothetical protein